MILYNCPQCAGSSLYPSDAAGMVNCRSCGAEFTLSQFTRNEPPSYVRITRFVQSTWQTTRRSTTLVYSVGGLACLALLWVAASAFGLLPDEFRVLNRRFASVSNLASIDAATALIAVGIPRQSGEIDFLGYGTAWAITNDGFMLTCKHVIQPTQSAANILRSHPRVWAYFGGRRVSAEIVFVDEVTDLALIKSEEPVDWKFRWADDELPRTVNSDVVTVGYHKLPDGVLSPVLDAKIAFTRGTISRTYQDRSGTPWIEHTAQLQTGASGGPLIIHDLVVGINVGASDRMSRAADLAGLQKRIMERVELHRKQIEARKEPRR